MALATTDSQRMLTVSLTRSTAAEGPEDGLMVTDLHGHIRFANRELAVMLGYSVDELMQIKLDALIPSPFNAMHTTKWLRHYPPTVPAASCRAGSVVHLAARSGVQVPVRLEVRQQEGAAEGTRHVVVVKHSTEQEYADARRVEITMDMGGRIRRIEPLGSTVYGW